MSFYHRARPAFFLFVILYVGMSTSASAMDTINRPDLEHIFADHQVIGTFVIHDISADKTQIVNPDRARKRFFPASTFKIANSLIALETGVVGDETEIIPYGGKPQHIKAWERDMSMRDAIKISNVPIYVELARRIGLDRYREWLDQLHYGNRQTGQTIGPFWLVGPLEISALEQINFLNRLVKSELPASLDTQTIVRDIIQMEKKDGVTLYAKSGWSTTPDPQIAWWVGWVERDGHITTFALNLDVDSRRQANLREPLTKTLLGKLGVWPGI